MPGMGDAPPGSISPEQYAQAMQMMGGGAPQGGARKVDSKSKQKSRQKAKNARKARKKARKR